MLNGLIGKSVVAGAVLLACVVAIVWSRAENGGASSSTVSHATLVDLQPWQTAQELAGMSVTAEEQQYAREAEHLADHDVDQAFASAIRKAQMAAQHKALQGEAVTLSEKVTQLKKLVADDQAHVQAVTVAGASADGTDDLELAKQQLGLDSDELADAQQDLARALGDERGRIQQELEAHEAAMKKYDAEVAERRQSATVTSRKYGTLATQMSAWFDQVNRKKLLEQAASQAKVWSSARMTEHDAMEKQPVARMDSGADRGTRLSAMRSRAMHSQMLSILDDRNQTEQHLSDVYTKWADQVGRQHALVGRLVIQSLAMLIVVLLGGWLLHLWVDHLLAQRVGTDRRLRSFQRIAKLLIQVVTLICALLVIFGTPSEMPTILGLTTAGLTVVLQDFIISFCGWFVLMGKNGIHVGDWVEINGVGGEVVEIGLFRTTLLETGNWNDRGHPTGRRVTFTNSFAVKGQYFNFTTSGQWMWDEMTINIPHSARSGEIAAGIDKAVLEETSKESRLAEDEWKKQGRATGLTQMSAEAAVNMRPGANGIDLVIRYVTRAATRYEVRNRLYQKALELIQIG